MLKPDYKVAKDRTKVEINYQNVDEKIKNIYKGKKYFLRTYGCQMNVHDSEAIASYLEKLGFTKTDVLEQSDIVVLNTCAIRENAHDKVFGFRLLGFQQFAHEEADGKTNDYSYYFHYLCFK